MTLYDLIKETSWTDVKVSLLWAYPDERHNLLKYEAVFRELSRMSPQASAMRICLEESKGQVHVGGRDGSLKKDHGVPETIEGANEEVTFALDFTPWTQWLGMEIDATALTAHTGAQIVAHCLWEMTVVSFYQEKISDKLEELKGSIAELDSMTKEEREKRLIPAEEVFENLKKRRMTKSPDLNAPSRKKRSRRGPLRGKTIELAPTREIEEFIDIYKEFIERMFGLEPGEYLITDESTLYDFMGPGGNELLDLQKTIRDTYGVDISNIRNGSLREIFKRIKTSKKGKTE